jgi:hypothetical protein
MGVFGSRGSPADSSITVRLDVGVGCGVSVASSSACVGSLLASGVAAGSGTAAFSSAGGELSSAATGGESSVPGGPSCSVFDEVLVSRVKLLAGPVACWPDLARSLIAHGETVARQTFWQGPLLAGLTWQGV